MNDSAKPQKAKTWHATSVQHLARHKSGMYYCRRRKFGKLVWTSLHTKNVSVARLKLQEHVEQAAMERSVDRRDTRTR